MVTDRMRSGRAPQRSQWRVLRAEMRFVVLTACLFTIIATLVGGHLYGRYLASLELGGRENAIEQLRAESQKLKTHADDLSAQATDLQVKLDRAQAALHAITPSDNAYNLVPNQSLIVADGHLTVGMVGAPGNEGVTLDINGRQQTLAAGQIVSVAPDPSTTCQVGVQSFDMFKAVLTATCSGAKTR